MSLDNHHEKKLIPSPAFVRHVLELADFDIQLCSVKQTKQTLFEIFFTRIFPYF